MIHFVCIQQDITEISYLLLVFVNDLRILQHAMTIKFQLIIFYYPFSSNCTAVCWFFVYVVINFVVHIHFSNRKRFRVERKPEGSDKGRHRAITFHTLMPLKHWRSNEGIWNLYGPKTIEVYKDPGLHSEEFHDVYSTTFTARVVKSWKLRWTEHKARIRKTKLVIEFYMEC
jgi:hypothetical protein